MKVIDVYQQILRDTIVDGMQLEDILLRALVLHTHSIVLRADVTLDDLSRRSNQRLVLAPLTRTHVTEFLSTLWPRSNDRGKAHFWLDHYCRLVAYEAFEDLPAELRDRALKARNSIAEHELVGELIEE